MKHAGEVNKVVLMIAIGIVVFFLLLVVRGYSQDAVSSRAEVQGILEEVYLVYPQDSIRVGYVIKRFINLSFKQTKEKTGLPPGWQQQFQNDKLLKMTVTWIVRHWQKTEAGFVYRVSIDHHVMRNGRYMPEESYSTNFPPTHKITAKEI